MSSSNPGKPDSHPPIAPSEDVLSFADGAEPTDENELGLGTNTDDSPGYIQEPTEEPTEEPAPVAETDVEATSSDVPE